MFIKYVTQHILENYVCHPWLRVGHPVGLAPSYHLHLCYSLKWRHNGHDSVSNHQPRDCLLNRLFRCRSKKTSKLRVTGLCARNSPVPDECPAQMANNTETVSIWWRHYVSIGKQVVSTELNRKRYDSDNLKTFWADGPSVRGFRWQQRVLWMELACLSLPTE